MSEAPNLNFFIVSKTTTADGKLLAATYNGSGGVVTVTEFANLDSQVWVLAPYDATSQTISPKNASDLVAGTDGNNIVKALSSANRHNWFVKGTLGTYIIVDVGNVNYWYINEAVVGQSIAKSPQNGSKLFDWMLILA
ncbi:hypothetical protein OG21DRAFT_1516787 [Imleria badia]|nr:hypothetical protein OG21DRAFT_1516787 [Imleria badia]